MAQWRYQILQTNVDISADFGRAAREDSLRIRR